MNRFARYIFAFCCIIFFSLRSTTGDGQIITTYAGNGYGAGFFSLIGGYAGDGGLAIYAELHNPNFVAYYGGSVYIADYSNDVVRKVDASNIITTVAGTGVQGYSGDGGPATSALLNGPTSIAFDPSGNLYIAESGNNVVRKVDASGTITTVAGTGVSGYSGNGGPATAAQLNDPQSISCDAAGNLYISDENSVIRKVDGSGIINVVVGTGVSGFSGDGGPATSAKIAQPMQVAFDTAGNLYFCDWNNWRIRKVDAAGIITTFAGNGTANTLGNGGLAIQAGLGDAAGISFDPLGDMYVSNQWNNSVRKIDLAGIITPVAGTGATGYSGDGGLATDATMDGPNTVCFDSSGNMYIADFWNNVVREVSMCSSVTAGSISNSGSNIFCNEGSDTLSLSGATAPGSSISYQWALSTDGVNYTKVGADTDVYVADTLKTTTYFKAYVICATSGKIDSTVVDTITINHNPTQYDTVCVGDTMTLVGNTGANELNWEVLPGGSPVSSLSCINCSNPIIAPMQTTRYVQVSSVGCNDTFAVLVLPVVKANFDTVICINDAVQLSVPADTVSGIIPHITWSPASSLSSSAISNPIANPASNTSYLVTVSYTSLCRVTDTVNVSVSPLSKPLALDTAICQNVVAPVLQVSGDSITWYTSFNMMSGTSVQPPISTLLPAFDTFYIANRCGMAPVSVEIKGLPTVKLGDDTSVCNDVVLQLTPQTEYVTAFSWNTGDTVCCITPDKSGQYTLEVSNSCGVAADTQTVFFAPCSECLWVPTAFTPNNDNLNDVFRVEDRCGTAASFHMVIVNRWGQILYDSYNISEGWNGTFNGQPVPVGTYSYFLVAEYSLGGGKKVELKGDITVVR